MTGDRRSIVATTSLLMTDWFSPRFRSRDPALLPFSPAAAAAAVSLFFFAFLPLRLRLLPLSSLALYYIQVGQQQRRSSCRGMQRVKSG